jgi:integrase
MRACEPLAGYHLARVSLYQKAHQGARRQNATGLGDTLINCPSHNRDSPGGTSPQVGPSAALHLAREGVPLNIIQRQLGHVNLGTTSVYLQGIDTEEIIAAVGSRRAPMMPAGAGLRL